MILADTSVIIDIWRNPDKKKQEIFERNEIATCHVIRAELVYGARSDKEKKKIENALNELKFIQTVDIFLCSTPSTLIFLIYIAKKINFINVQLKKINILG